MLKEMVFDVVRRNTGGKSGIEYVGGGGGKKSLQHCMYPPKTIYLTGLPHSHCPSIRGSRPLLPIPKKKLGKQNINCQPVVYRLACLLVAGITWYCLVSNPNTQSSPVTSPTLKVLRFIVTWWGWGMGRLLESGVSQNRQLLDRGRLILTLRGTLPGCSRARRLHSKFPP